jgi:DNA replication and repair protein RecF
MYLNHLSLTHFRNFARLDIDLPGRVTILAGDNAQGKTSILESIYFLAAFTSFQTHTDRQVINFIAAREPLAVTRLVGDYQRGQANHRLEVRVILEPTGALNGQRTRKEVLLDGVKKSASDLVGHFGAVIYLPQMSQVIEGSPDERRRYLNLTLAQVIPAYTRLLNDYNQALSQRNALLKGLNERSAGGELNGSAATQLDLWDETLADLGAQIIHWRIQAVGEIERLASPIQTELTAGREVLRLDYQPAYDPLKPSNGQMNFKLETIIDRSKVGVEELRVGFRERLRSLRGEEIARGQTTIGPQRDDLRFIVNKNDLGDYGSRGQIRTTLLALKLAEVRWMKERTGEWPVILLDEVMAELDLQRRADLLKHVSGAEQSLFTTTDLKLFDEEFCREAQVWRVREGGLNVYEVE